MWPFTANTHPDPPPPYLHWFSLTTHWPTEFEVWVKLRLLLRVLKEVVRRRRNGQSGPYSVGLIRGEKGGVHRLHAWRTGERAHQPIIYAVHVIDVHAWQEPDWISINKVHHADYTPEKEWSDMTLYLYRTQTAGFILRAPFSVLRKTSSRATPVSALQSIYRHCTYSLIFFSEPSWPPS